MNDRSSRADHFRANLVLGGFLLVGAFYLLTEHRAHLFGILPYLIFLACPMMHLFMHHGHHHHGKGASPGLDGSADQPARPDREMLS